MGPSTTELMQSEGAPSHLSPTETEDCRANPESLFCDADVPASLTSGRGRCTRGGEDHPEVCDFVRRPSRKGRKTEILLVRRPSTLSVGALSIRSTGRTQSFSPQVLRRAEPVRTSGHRQRSQSDVIRQATMAAREMRRSLEATERTQQTLQDSIGQLDSALTRLKVITSDKQRARSMRMAKPPRRYRPASSTTDQDLDEDTRDMCVSARPLTTEPKLLHDSTPANTPAVTPAWLAVPPPSIFGSDSLLDELRLPPFSRVALEESDRNDSCLPTDDTMSCEDDFDVQSLMDMEVYTSEDEDGEESASASTTSHVVLTLDGAVYTLTVDEFRQWLASQEESWC